MLSDIEELFGANTLAFYTILKVVLQAVKGAFVNVPLSSVSNFLITFVIMCRPNIAVTSNFRYIRKIFFDMW